MGSLTLLGECSPYPTLCSVVLTTRGGVEVGGRNTEHSGGPEDQFSWMSQIFESLESAIYICFQLPLSQVLSTPLTCADVMVESIYLYDGFRNTFACVLVPDHAFYPPMDLQIERKSLLHLDAMYRITSYCLKL